MIHSFDVGIAGMVGVNAAILFYNLDFWCYKNACNGQSYIRGNYWTYCTIKGFTRYLPEFTEKQIRGAIIKLIESGLIIAEENIAGEISLDRTKWYAITAKGKRLSGNWPPERANANAPEGNSADAGVFGNISEGELPIRANGNAQKGKSYTNVSIQDSTKDNSCCYNNINNNKKDNNLPLERTANKALVKTFYERGQKNGFVGLSY